MSLNGWIDIDGGQDATDDYSYIGVVEREEDYNGERKQNCMDVIKPYCLIYREYTYSVRPKFSELEFPCF